MLHHRLQSLQRVRRRDREIERKREREEILLTVGVKREGPVILFPFEGKRSLFLVPHPLHFSLCISFARVFRSGSSHPHPPLSLFLLLPFCLSCNTCPFSPLLFTRTTIRVPCKRQPEVKRDSEGKRRESMYTQLSHSIIIIMTTMMMTMWVKKQLGACCRLWYLTLVRSDLFCSSFLWDSFFSVQRDECTGEKNVPSHSEDHHHHHQYQDDPSLSLLPPFKSISPSSLFSEEQYAVA